MEYFFETREEASRAAAERIAAALTRRMDGNGAASLVVSGGTTPAATFAELAAMPLEWSRVHVVMSDERWVPTDHEDSNEKLVRDILLKDRAADATLLPIYSEDVQPDERCEQLQDELKRVPFPFACSLLGMGEDGHFASLFPDAENLDKGLITDWQQLVMPVHTAASPHPRISLTLAALSRSDEIVLLIFGDAKREVIEAAKIPGSELPVSALLLQKRAPVSVLWAP
jgi:6-phosphogluconolactonase